MSQEESRIERLRELACSLRLSNLKNQAQELALQAEQAQMTPVQFLETVLEQELKGRKRRANKRRFKESGLPYIKSLDDFELSRLENFNADKLERLAELDWIEEGFNLFLIGGPGTGKTHLACALAYQAITQGYPASFVTMNELISLLKESPGLERDQRRLNRISSSQILVIDGVGDFPVSSLEATLFLQLLNQLHESCSIVITANNGPSNWPEVFKDDSQLLSALDRLLFKCEVIELKARSYRVEHRQSFLDV